MSRSYYQFCPVAKAMELLDERWTLLVIRELLSGSERFNELRRGLPRMSPSLLSTRLQQLVRAGLVERTAVDGDVRYAPTAAAAELRPVIEALGVWGVRWMGELGDRDLDPRLLMWDIHRRVNHAALPRGRTVVEFCFRDAESRMRQWWLVLTADSADICDTDPGHPVDVRVTASLRAMTDVWMGELSWSDALRDGTLRAEGPAELRRQLPEWLMLSLFAPAPRVRTPAALKS